MQRSYFPNGQLRGDTLLIRDASTGVLEGYGLRYDYDTSTGQMLRLHHPAGLAGSTSIDTYQYNASTGELTGVLDRMGNTFGFLHDKSGRLTRMDLPGGIIDSRIYDVDGRLAWRQTMSPAHAVPLLSEGYAYDARDKVLRVAVGPTLNRSDTTTYTQWYSGLGNLLVMVITRRPPELCSVPGATCISSVTRFVWSGDQLLWEMKSADGPYAAEAGGTVSYTHGGGLDRPLAITRSGVGSIIPHESWRGQMARGTYGAGTGKPLGASSDCPSYPAQNCVPVPWPGWNTSAWHEEAARPELTGTEHYWFGSLAVGMRDASGQMYKRNRYYNPQTGQFTQPDPIGLAGGMNVYGFAAGDPVTYDDPYGLCTPMPGCLLDALRSASGRAQAHLEGAAAEQLAKGGLNRIAGVALVTASAFTEFGMPDRGVSRHHIATDKNNVSTQRGGPWTPLFKALFAGAGMSMQDPENVVDIAGHQGPHSEIYHRVVFDRLFTATEGLTGDQYKDALVGELRQLRSELRTPGSDLNKLVTAGP